MKHDIPRKGGQWIYSKVYANFLLAAKKNYCEFSRFLGRLLELNKVINLGKNRSCIAAGPQQFEFLDTVSGATLCLLLPKFSGSLLIHWLLPIYRKQRVAHPHWASCQPPSVSPGQDWGPQVPPTGMEPDSRVGKQPCELSSNLRSQPGAENLRSFSLFTEGQDRSRVLGITTLPGGVVGWRTQIIPGFGGQTGLYSETVSNLLHTPSPFSTGFFGRKSLWVTST